MDTSAIINLLNKNTAISVESGNEKYKADTVSQL